MPSCTTADRPIKPTDPFVRTINRSPAVSMALDTSAPGSATRFSSMRSITPFTKLGIRTTGTPGPSATHFSEVP